MMEPLEWVSTIDLPDQRVAIAGDWHGRADWAQRAIPALGRTTPDVSTILHVGDFWASEDFCRTVDYWCLRSGIQRVLVTLGNHEPYDWIAPTMTERPGEALRVSETVWLLPRPFRLNIGGVPFLSVGGAASVDRFWRRPGVDWWIDEAITDDQVDAAIAGGHAPVMVTHESPHATPVEAVRRILATNPQGFTPDALAYSAASRERVDRVWTAVAPRHLFHGHMHAPGSGVTADGRAVHSLGMNGQERNLVILDTADLTVDFVPHAAIVRR